MLSPDHILRTGFGFRAARALLSAVEIGLFTELGKGPRSSRQICRALGLEEGAGSALLDALVAMGLLLRDGEGARALYLNTRECAHFLDRGSSAYIGTVLEQESTRSYEAWRKLTNAVLGASRNGRPGRVMALRASASIEAAARVLAERFDFSGYRTLMDLGRARGLFARVLKARHAHLRCRSVALPARPVRWRSMPGADVVLAPSAIGSFEVRSRTQLLKKVWRTLPPNGCLLIVERLIDRDSSDAFDLLASLNQYVGTRKPSMLTRPEVLAACRDAGFARTEALPLIFPFWAVAAYKGDGAIR